MVRLQAPLGQDVGQAPLVQPHDEAHLVVLARDAVHSAGPAAPERGQGDRPELLEEGAVLLLGCAGLHFDGNVDAATAGFQLSAKNLAVAPASDAIADF